MTAPARPLLTVQQLAALRLVANGHARPVVGRRLGMPLGTVHKRLTAAYRALGVHHEAHAVAVAMRLGLLTDDDIRLPQLAPGVGAPAARATLAPPGPARPGTANGSSDGPIGPQTGAQSREPHSASETHSHATRATNPTNPTRTDA